MTKKFYSCFSPKMMAYLAENGVLPIKMEFHNKTNKRMWIYEMNEKLSDYLIGWSTKSNLK